MNDVDKRFDDWKRKLQTCLNKLKIPDDKWGLIFATVKNLLRDQRINNNVSSDFEKQLENACVGEQPPYIVPLSIARIIIGSAIHQELRNQAKEIIEDISEFNVDGSEHKLLEQLRQKYLSDNN